MDITSLPKPDELLDALLAYVFGPTAFIVVAYKLYLIAAAWLDAVAAGRRIASSGRDHVRRFVAAGLATTAGAFLLVIGAAAVMAAWLYLSNVMANVASFVIFGGAKTTLTGDFITPYLSWRHDDVASTVVFQGAVILVLLSVVLGLMNRSIELLAWLLSLPWILAAFAMSLGFAANFLTAAVNWLIGKGFVAKENLLIFVALGLAAAGYAWTTILIARLPGKVRIVVGRTLPSGAL